MSDTDQINVELKADVFAAPQGEVYPRWFRAGAIVSGNVAAIALEEQKGVIVHAKPAAGADGEAHRKPPANKAASVPAKK